MEEDFKPKDMSKPFYERPPGEIGIYLDPFDAEPLNPNAFGSKLFFFNDLTEKLFAELNQTKLEVIKGNFERRNLLQGVYFEGFHKGVILSVSFDKVDSLEKLWCLYEKNELASIIVDIFVSPELLKKTEIKSIELRTRMWKDEYESCKREIQQNLVPPFTLNEKPNDIGMLKQVKEYQHELANNILTLKDDLNKFDQTLGKFLMIYKHNIPGNVEKVTTLNQMEEHIELFKSKRLDLTTFRQYKATLASLREVLANMEVKISHPLAQIHSQCESPAQRDLKVKIKDTILEWQRQLKPDADLSKLRHPEWKSKILLREQRLFLSLVSLPAYATEAVKDTDLALDEYLSGVQTPLKD